MAVFDDDDDADGGCPPAPILDDDDDDDEPDAIRAGILTFRDAALEAGEPGDGRIKSSLEYL